MPLFIQIHNLTHTPPPTQNVPSRPILQGINLEIPAGQYIAIVGQNGSGKTTLARHLNALLLPSAGSVIIDGLDTRHSANHPLIRSRVGMVFQDPQDQIVATTVEEDVAFGPESIALPPAEIRHRVEHALQTVGMTEHRQRPPHLLSLGQLQRVAVAGVLALLPRCIIFDESTSMLDPKGRRMALNLMSELHSQGLTILHITHFMEEAVLAERVIVLHNGTLVLDGSPEQVFSPSSNIASYGLELPPALRLALALQPAFTQPLGFPLIPGDLLNALPPGPGFSIAPVDSSPPRSLPAVEVRNLSHIYLRGTPLEHMALNNANLSIERHRSHALLGPTGSGKSTLLQHLNGLIRPQQGTVRVDEFQFDHPEVDLRSARLRIGLAFQNPELQFFEQYCGDEIAYGIRKLYPPNQVRQRVHTVMESIGLDFNSYKDRLLATLSGGEKRKVALASVLVRSPTWLLLDEPFAGLDPSSRQDTAEKLINLQQSGVTMLISSHYLEDLPRLAVDATILYDGASTLSGTLTQVLENIDALHSFDLEPPVIIRVAHRLRQLGWGIPMGSCTVNSILAALHTEERV